MAKKKVQSDYENEDIGKENDNNRPVVSPSLEELLKSLVSGQRELNDRLSDLEEATAKGGQDLAKIQLANMYFKPEDQYLLDMSYISPLAARPLAEALALDKQTSEEVRSGQVSLNVLVIYNWLHALRGVRGRMMGIGAEAMKEQVSAESARTEEGMAEFEAGRE